MSEATAVVDKAVGTVTGRPVRTLLVDDHTILRQGLKRVLEHEPDLEVCGEAEDGRSAIEKVNALQPDVVVMDLAMPNLNGLDATRRILRNHPEMRILALSMYMDDGYVEQAVEAGVQGYVLKSAPPSRIVEAIKALARGERYFAPEIPEAVLDRAYEAKRRPRRCARLTDREREVMKLLAEGMTVREAADALGLSQKTVDTHKTNLMKKLDIHNRVELVRLAIEEKLVQL